MKISKKLVVITIIFIIGLSSMGTKSFALDKKLKVDGRCAIAIEKETGKVLFEQNGYEIVEMASTTKILTALVAIENSNLEDKFIVSKKAAGCRGSKVGYKANEEIAVRELLYGLMYKSGNDAAITLAEGIGGSEEEFARIMNHYSSSLGLIDSHFQTPHGLDKEDHYSSAYDLAILTSKAMDYKIFREIVGSKQTSKEKYNFTRDYNNINKILWQIEGANGVKTGYTGKAGKCLVTSVNNKGKDIIIVVLNCPKRWEETKKIYDKVKESSTVFKDSNLEEEKVVYSYNPGKKLSFIETYE
ncbi:MAG: D-alanyl-D-alanine carboxypeptidase family protein [Clostridium sp.]|uniref:D-alanyl-D-alanine carboxypeptidase family protein n=1 Tax=Clostridium sp. TaxID=1506 RepID=UPI003EE6D0DF